MNIKKLYCDYIKLVRQEYTMKQKTNKVYYSLYGDYEEENRRYLRNKDCCFAWVILGIESELKECPNFEKTSLENLSACQNCSNFKERLRYEIYKSEYTKIHNKKIGVKQELQNAIKQSLKKLISKGK